jgi:hypothetical protein
MMKKVYIILGILMAICLLLTMPLIYKYSQRFTVLIGVNNQSGLMITNLLIKEPEDTDWVATELPNHGIETGKLIRISPIGYTCLRDIKITYQNGTTEEMDKMDGCQGHDIMISEKVMRGTKNPSFNVINAGRESITQVYVSASDYGKWGQNRVGTDTEILPSTSLPITLPSGKCIYDARIIFKSGAMYDKKKINTCEISFMSFP